MEFHAPHPSCQSHDHISNHVWTVYLLQFQVRKFSATLSISDSRGSRKIDQRIEINQHAECIRTMEAKGAERNGTFGFFSIFLLTENKSLKSFKGQFWHRKGQSCLWGSRSSLKLIRYSESEQKKLTRYAYFRTKNIFGRIYSKQSRGIVGRNFWWKEGVGVDKT